MINDDLTNDQLIDIIPRSLPLTCQGEPPHPSFVWVQSSGESRPWAKKGQGGVAVFHLHCLLLDLISNMEGSVPPLDRHWRLILFQCEISKKSRHPLNTTKQSFENTIAYVAGRRVKMSAGGIEHATWAWSTRTLRAFFFPFSSPWETTHANDAKSVSDAESTWVRGTLPDFIQWGPGYESVYYGINNTRPIYSERAHRALQNL